MKQEAETLSLANGELTIHLKAYDYSAFQALTPEMQFALVIAGVDGWKYRRATRRPKDGEYTLQSKTLSLADIAADLVASPVRSDGPSKADKAKGETVLKGIIAGLPAQEKLAGDASQADIDQQRAERKAQVRAALEAKAEGMRTAGATWLRWGYDPEKTSLDNASLLAHAVRTQQPKLTL